MSLPVKDVAEAMGDTVNLRSSLAQSQMSINKSRYDENRMNERRSMDASSLKIPNTNVNQAKLKIILSQLKKVERDKSRTSRE